jgi:multicomponent Na+:H+ antiporter subunit C
MSVYPYVVAVFVFCVGIAGVVTSRNFIHLIVSLAVAQSATYVLLLAIGYRTKGTAPIQYQISKQVPQVDPVVQALTLTDVVVSVAVSALLLAIALHVHQREGTMDPEELHGMQG